MSDKNGLDLQLIHEERLSKLEKTTTDLAVNLAAQSVEVRSLRTEMGIGHNHIMDKLESVSERLSDKISNLSQNIDKANNAENKHDKRLDAIELSSKFKSHMWKVIIGGAGSGVYALVEWLVRHKN